MRPHKQVCLLVLGLAQLWFTGRAPRILRVASLYSLSPGLVLRRVILRRWDQFQRWTRRKTGLDRPRIGPKEYEAIVEWRTRLGHHVASGTPAEALLVTKGVKAAMAIKGVMPKTTCFLQVRVPRHPHYLSLKLPRSST